MMGKERIRMDMFAWRWNISREDMQTICEGRFNEWKKDFDKYIREEYRSRIETGKARKIDINDVWGGSRWIQKYI